ncbi:SDR family NAD(P)-dependent oxidoreductase [Noviherbaspirillum sp. Root189]|uniref:SDR family NAD(P)-dependent oxidoreductase n=1 Tax=Noviherbaspirillum sp. Root189 TaxID=1736487 RepID=UPI00070C042D|nr:SDR family oxidoreductase [Noviherbaspirillum sp. Root189]KRB82165.1 hypothetical protein ASE07_24015 [Noviherbaspirillum sp. Root189]
MYNNEFDQKVCIVTGAASGIGFALAETLLDAGAFVCLADRDESALLTAASRLGSPSKVSSFVVDVTDARQVSTLIVFTLEQSGRIDFLFNNAGIGGTLPITEATLEHWQRIIDVNLWGVIHGIHAVLPVMRQQGAGHIVNTASISGLLPIPGQALYNTTKYAIVGLSESLRIELKSENIAVSVACPGPVASSIWGKPIIGARTDRQAPATAVTPQSAALAILSDITRAPGIIVFPSRDLWGWRMYRWVPALVERALRLLRGTGANVSKE